MRRLKNIPIHKGGVIGIAATAVGTTLIRHATSKELSGDKKHANVISHDATFGVTGQFDPEYDYDKICCSSKFCHHSCTDKDADKDIEDLKPCPSG